MTQVQFKARKGKATVSGHQYKQGQHPPPPGVTVTMGLHGIVARVTTAAGPHSVVLDGDWLLTMPDGGVEIFTDEFVRNTYQRVGEEDGPVKPVKLG